MNPPIFIFEGKSFDIYDTVEKANASIEPPDVRNNDYSFYDSEGLKLRAIVTVDDMGIERCSILPTPDAENGAEELKDAIVDYLDYISQRRKDSKYHRRSLSRMTLRALVEESLKLKDW